METKQIYYGGGVKTVGDNGRITGYLIPFTDANRRDLHGEYFDATTDLHIRSPDEVVGFRVLYHHGLDPDVKFRNIGKFVRAQIDEIGLWVEAQLDLADEYARAIYELARRGLLGWSSGAIPYSVEVDDDGHIKSWALVEGSLTPAPAMPNLTKITPANKMAIKSINELIGDINKMDEMETTQPEPTAPTEADNLTAMLTRIEELLRELLQSTIQPDDKLELENVVEEAMHVVEDAAKMDEADEDDLVEKAATKAAELIHAARSRRERAAAILNAKQTFNTPTSGGAKLQPATKSQPKISGVVDRALDHLTPEDIDFAVDVLRKMGRTPSDRLMNAHAAKTGIKANEVMNSGLTGYGDEHVPTLWRDQLWMRARRDNVVASQFRAFDMPSNPFELPIESGDPTVYHTSETADASQLTYTSSGALSTSRIGTTKVTLTASKLSARVHMSGELEEDVFAQFVPAYREQVFKAMLYAIDNVILNGDTDTSTANINTAGATPTSGSAFLALNGLIKNAIITAPTNAVDMGGVAPTLAAIRNARFTLDRSKTKPDDLVIFVHPEVEKTLLNIDEFLTVDKAGNRATNVNGTIGFIDNIPVLVSNEIALSDANGKIDGVTSGNNVRGRLIIAHKPSVALGYRRQITTHMDYIPAFDAWSLVAHVRFGLALQDNDSVAVLYNIAV
ncbi:MAG: hypothetical protein D6712_21335 [Chloroflexi bacterium]|nr:MAG: hypothetical protein D6712_21335 [Chloroflexota bacterium]